MKSWSAAIVLALVASACGSTGIGPDPPPPPPPPPPPQTTATFVGAGDIGWCGPDGGPELTARLLDGITGATVFTTGDNAYFDGTLTDYLRCYDPSWGRHKGVTRPTLGNHEYHVAEAPGYFDYFGDAAGNRGEGWYSYPLAAWYVFALNSEKPAFPGSPQYVWLRNELTLHPTRCALAYFHTPVFASGENGGNNQMQAVWALLQELGVDVIIAGHNHNYERFAPQDANGRPDPRGIRQFVVGTGGAPLVGFRSMAANSQVRDNSTWGVLRLTLRPESYEWQFVPVAGRSFSDPGSDVCH